MELGFEEKIHRPQCGADGRASAKGALDFAQERGDGVTTQLLQRKAPR